MPDWLAIIFLALFGACIGSFLNVVIYRLPRKESIVSPPSHCPGCNRPIGWYDNIPVVSYLWLGGRCRSCGLPISPRYSLVELVTAVVFVAVYDSFYRVGMHPWFGGSPFDCSLLASHLALLAVLVACSAIDIEYYLIDVRLTYFAIAVGIAGWMLVPGSKMAEVSSGFVHSPAIFIALLGALGGGIFRHFVLVGQSEPETIEEESCEDNEQPAYVSSGSHRWSVFALWILALGFVGLVLWSIYGGVRREEYYLRALVYVLWSFLTIIIGGIPRRESDRAIVELIEQEKSSARKTAFKELVSLVPVMIGFAGGYFAAGVIPWVEKFYRLAVGPFFPMMGLAQALWGLAIAAALGWLVRILFTIGFGKEAMGAGDIYILAAIGSVAGPFVAIVGFFIGSVIGVLGIVVLLLWKISRALSYGPWIAIGSLVCLLFYDPIANYLQPVVRMVLQICFGFGGE